MSTPHMETRIVRAGRDGWDMNGLHLAAQAIAAGELVAFPTETVYGLGANALDEAAVRLIYQVKGRPEDNPLIVHVAHPAQILDIAAEIPPVAIRLIERFMPGPLTLVLKRSGKIPPAVSAGLDTVAVRCPAHPVAQAFISMAGVPVAAPSANLSGRPSPTRAAHVIADLNGRIPYIIDGGECEVGLESTVLDVTGEVPVILRPGAITASQITEACGIKPRLAGDSESGAARSPGMKYRHYAPRARVLVGTGHNALARVRNTSNLALDQVKCGLRVGVFASSTVADEIAAAEKGVAAEGRLVRVLSFGDSGDSVRASARLFDALRTLDQENVDVIIVQALPEEGLGAAYMNRVLKASAPDAR